MKLPRFMIAAPRSGSGKTLITCGILSLLKESGQKVRAFKCGPDYIDPMFHKKVLETDSYNLDPFLAEGSLPQTFLRHIGDATFAVMEGVMGYYDGIAGISTKASSFEVAQKTGTPVILVVDTKGTSVSLVPLIKGFLEFQEESCIQGVILNRMSPMLYPRMKQLIEQELDIKVCGYVPESKDAGLLSRHLGLVMPQEIPQLQSQIRNFAQELRKTLDLTALSQVADQALDVLKVQEPKQEKKTLRVALARDEAFLFAYQDNLQLLEENGIELVPFSPIHDAHLPKDIHGLILYGGYPELHAKALSANVTMRQEIKEKLAMQLPCMAECGGYLYLHDRLEDTTGMAYDMVGVLEGSGHNTGKLVRFGYINLVGKAFDEENIHIRAHEFHYYDTPYKAQGMVATKPMSDRSWQCMVSTHTLLAGFPHLYYPSCPYLPRLFAQRCQEYKEKTQ